VSENQRRRDVQQVREEATTMTQTSPTMMAHLTVSDVDATLDWFRRLGFTTEYLMTMPDGSVAHAEVARGAGVRIMFGPARDMPVGSAGMSLYIYLDGSVDAYHAHVTAAGITAEGAPEDQPWGDRLFHLQHPDGYHFTFAQHVKDVSPEELSQAMAAVPA
jgi:uncharacterized glyoxalase superfamily protein PhnB